jgi:hypothetical protein
MKTKTRRTIELRLMVGGRRGHHFRTLLILLVAFLAMLLPGIAASQGTYYYLYQFGGNLPGGYPDGQQPVGGVSFDRAGNMYGTAGNGGRYQAPFPSRQSAVGCWGRT